MDSKEIKTRYEKESGQKSGKTLHRPNEQKSDKYQYPRTRYGDMDLTKVIIKK